MGYACAGNPGNVSPPSRVSDPEMHRDPCVKHVPLCMPGSLASGFLGSRWWGKRSQHSWRMRNPQFYVSGKKPMWCMMTSPRPHPYRWLSAIWGKSRIPCYWHVLTFIPAWVNNYMPWKVWHEITYPLLNFNSYTVVVWERIRYFTPHFMVGVIAKLRLKSIHVSIMDPSALGTTHWR